MYIMMYLTLLFSHLHSDGIRAIVLRPYCVYDAYKRHLLCQFVCIFSLSKCGRYLCDMFRILLYLYVLYHVDI